MYPNLKDIGVRNPQSIKRYSLRQEGDKDVLKIYFRKSGGMLIGRSSKFIFQRQDKVVCGGADTQNFTHLSEINPKLHKIIAELDSLSVSSSSEKELKQEILSDLKHLKLVVDGKIEEIEGKLDKLEKNL